MKAWLIRLLMKLELFYDPKFDSGPKNYVYTKKTSPWSIHHYMRELPLRSGSTLLDVGGGSGEAVSKAHADRGVVTTCIDLYSGAPVPGVKHHSVDLDHPWKDQAPLEKYDTVFALDVIEHLKSPESGVAEIHARMEPGRILYASTGNVAFFVIRILLLFGKFSYARKGILDQTHLRLFTVEGFRRLLENGGFKIEKKIPFGICLEDALGHSHFLLRLFDRFSSRLARMWPGLFAYQILFQVVRPHDHEDLMSKTFQPMR